MPQLLALGTFGKRVSLIYRRAIPERYKLDLSCALPPSDPKYS